MAHIEARHYEETRQRLMQDPIVQQMAAEIAVARYPLSHLQHESGTPRFEFMLSANEEYVRRGGDREHPEALRHIGAVAEAILRILTKPDVTPLYSK